MMTEELLQEIARNGWNEERARRFIRQYDHEIKRQILYWMMKSRFISSEEDLQRLRRELDDR